MIDTSGVKIIFDAIGSDEILQNLRTLYTTPQGTVPFDRDFGIDFKIGRAHV